MKPLFSNNGSKSVIHIIQNENERIELTQRKLVRIVKIDLRGELSIHVNYRFIQLGFLLKFESAYFGLFTQNSVLGFENVLFVRSIL
ncbi:hypothetical protein B2G50_16185 [Leptospira interrogans serovar Canicola]|nr:hypothetical protein B2G50_16185 [Leptospira interrogans serovar Canicola]